MKFTENYAIAEEFESLFDFSEKDQLSLDALWIAAKFLSIIQDEIISQQITRKELAQRIGKSPSWLTQVFRGDKLPSLETITQLQNALNIEFDIKRKNEVVSISYKEKEAEEKFPKAIVPLKPNWMKKMNIGKIDYDATNSELENQTLGGSKTKYLEVA